MNLLQLFKFFIQYCISVSFNILVFITLFILFGMGIVDIAKNMLSLHQIKVVKIDNLPLFEAQTVYGKLQEAGVYYPEYAYWQFYHESGKFKSAIYKDCNNGCGMKVPSIRKFWGTGHCRGHAGYSTFDHNIIDYKEYQEFTGINRMKIYSLEEYLKIMQRFKYAEDKDYVDNIIRLYEKDKNLPYK